MSIFVYLFNNLYLYSTIMLLFIKDIKYFCFRLYFNTYFYIKHLFSPKRNKLYNGNRNEKIIISLTTYSKRIKYVYKTIESLFSQTIKPDKIILWLDENEFNINSIPKTLKKQIKCGLEIGFCENIKSYKKIVPTLKKYQNDIIITADDDILYPKNFIEKLYIAYLDDKIENNDKKSVYCNYSFKFLDNNLFPKARNISYLFSYVGTGGGCLFPPHILPDDIFNKDLFMKLAENHDDAFISVLLLKNNIKVHNVNENYLTYVKLIHKRLIFNTQGIGLWRINLEKSNGTGATIKRCLEYYGIELERV